MAYTRADFERAVSIIRSRTTQEVKVGLVLGSGLGGLADQLENRTVIPYGDIPGWPRSTVHGHAGQLVIGTLEGCPVVAQQGRAHFYEGYDLQQVTFPIRVMNALGVKTLILTNAAGGINPAFNVGDVMMLNDHINFVGMVGNNPLMGPNDDSLGERFVGMAHTYDLDLRKQAHQTAKAANLTLHEGVYCCLSGPTFETPAEIRMLRVIGADAVGMSTVHEVLVARHGGMRVLAFSGITNKAIDHVDSSAETSHQEVLETSTILVPKLTTLLRGVLRSLS
ncbi:MAG TPA: purine-nucleoside phosphorylase [Phototrophicaceae bacterium]|nr:purine-nucleoside phosphorylase [Phototrophicaceae bacterium]